MPLVLSNRVQETGAANTTVSFTLAGAVSGFQTFTAGVGDGNTTYYSATDTAGNWEVGLGTFSTTGPTLTRTTIYESSNADSAVTFSGTVNVFVTYPAEKAVVTSNNPGTSGEVLISNGSGVAPSWQAAPTPSCATPCTPGIVFGLTNASNTALGASTFACGTNGVALGNGAGVYCNGIAIGKTAYAFGCGAINIGRHCGSSTGAFGPNSITIGRSAVTCSSATNSIAIGTNASAYPANSVAIGACVSTTGSFQTHIGPIRNVCSTTGLTSLFYNTCTKEVVQATGGGGGGSPATPTIAGIVYGRTDSGCFGGNVGLGYGSAGSSSGSNSVSVGFFAGQSCQQSNAIAIGGGAGSSIQGTSAIAIGLSAGNCSQCSGAIAIGFQAGAVAQGTAAIAIGYQAGVVFQPANSIVIAACGIGFNASGACRFHVKPIRNATGPYTLKYDPSTGEITYI